MNDNGVRAGSELVQLGQLKRVSGRCCRSPRPDAHRERMNAMRSIRIPLYSRKYPDLFTTIDEDDWDMVKDLRLMPQYSPSVDKFYAVFGRAKTRRTLHRILVSAPAGLDVDHVNGDTLDNRKSNLRIVTRQQNLGNVTIRTTNSSGYKGVSLHRKTAKWRAMICVNRRALSLGLFGMAEDAAHAYDEAARKYCGEFACVNFPNPGERSALTGEIEGECSA